VFFWRRTLLPLIQTRETYAHAAAIIVVLNEQIALDARQAHGAFSGLFGLLI
jgi:hypothetical protein